MVKIVIMFRRKPGLSKSEFAEYWRTEHADIVQKYAEALRIKRYVQTVSIESDVVAAIRTSRGWTDTGEIDGVAELWWSDKQEFESAMTSPEGQAALAELAQDEENFGDTSAAMVILSTENVVIGD